MTAASQRPDRNVIPGDVVYFNHKAHGALSGRVRASGQHGCTIEHECGEGGLHRARWEDVLGHKERKVRKLKIVERGEDGGIATDEDGNRVFVHGEIPPGEDEEDLAKAFTPPPQPLLVDIGHLHGPSCDHALEGLYKALSGADGVAFDIWQKHESPFIRGIIEKFSDRGLTKIAAVQSDLALWMTGQHHVPHKDVVTPPPGYMLRWSQDELDLVRIYLESLPPAELSFDDWSLLVDYMVQRYLPADALHEEADWLAAKSNMLGRMQAQFPLATEAMVGSIVEALPGSVDEAVKMFRYADHAESIMAYGRAHATEAVTAFTETTRHRLKRTILAYEAKRLAGEPVDSTSLQQELFDQFDQLNRDWRRIAITEAGEIANQGIIAALPHGSKVRRLEAYSGACPFCRKLHGRIFRVTTAGDNEKDGFTDVWPGKTNIGRSASPMKRVGGELVARDPDEKWWAAAGLQHPHCRGRWEPVQSEQPGDDPAFAAWLRKRLGQQEGAHDL